MDRYAVPSSSRPNIQRSASTTAGRSGEPQRKPSTSRHHHHHTTANTPAPPPKISRSNTTQSAKAPTPVAVPYGAYVSQPGSSGNVTLTRAPSSSRQNTLTRPPPVASTSANVKRSNTTPTLRGTGWTPLVQTAINNSRHAQAPGAGVTLTQNAAPVTIPEKPGKGHLGRSKSESHRPNANETAPIYDVFKGLNNGKKGMVLPTIVQGVATKNAVIAATEDAAIIDSGLPGVKSGHIVKVVESGGVCLHAAQKALYGRHLSPKERITWHRTTEQDKRMEMLLDWIEKTRWGLASLGFHKFLATRSKGALIFNVHGRLATSPQEPAVDWITFDDAQRTLDTQMQEYIANYDPATHTLVFAFRLSPNEQSLKIWGKKIGVPPQLVQNYTQDVDSIRKELRKKKFSVLSEDPTFMKSGLFSKWFKSKK